MIGLLTQPEEREIAAEFFELFKTPWEFARDGQRYDVLINTRDEGDDAEAGLVLRYGAGQRAFDRENNIGVTPCRDTAAFLLEGRRVPLYGAACGFASDTPPLPVEGSKDLSAVFVTRTSRSVTVRIGYNLFDEIRFLITTGQPSANAAQPTLECHIALLRELILENDVPLIEIPPAPAGFNFIACLTHDVDHYGIRNHKCDHTMFGFVYRALVGSVIRLCRGRISFRQLVTNWAAVCRLPLVHLGWAGDFWCQLDRFLEIENGAASTFFVIPFKDRPGHSCNGRGSAERAASYGLDEMREDLKRIDSAGCEIGLHGIDAWCDTSSGRAERDQVAQTTGRAPQGVRMHWLFFDEQSPARLEAAGFSYDSTVGYNDRAGYRAGTLQAFKPMGVTHLMELPLHIMDTALFYPSYMNLSPVAAEAVMSEMVDEAVHFGGALTFNWHDRSIAPERLWDGSYAKVISELKRKGGCFFTAGQAVSWFRKRRSAVIENVTWAKDRVRVKASAGFGNDNLTGLRIRIHHPSARRSGSGVGYVDVTLDGSMDEDVLLESASGNSRQAHEQTDSVGNPTVTPK